MPLANMEEIYQAHARTVYKFLLSQCHDADLAEELTQETFYQAVRSIDRFNGSCKVSVWLCQIAKHLWYQHLRKRKPEEPLPEDGLPGPSAEEDVLTRQGHLDLLRQIHALPPSTREVVYLRAFGGLSFREIGDVLGRTETWARVTFYRGILPRLCGQADRHGGEGNGSGGSKRRRDRPGGGLSEKGAAQEPAESMAGGGLHHAGAGGSDSYKNLHHWRAGTSQ